MAALAPAVLLAACAIDDSGPVRSVWRPENGKPSYVNVVYLTDRQADAKAAGGFGANWADEASCGMAQTIIPAALLPGEEPKWGYVAKTKPFACATDKSLLGGVVAQIEAQAKARGCRSVFLFVHGFHTGFDGAVLRAAQIAYDAQTGCAVAAFSWSSEVKLDRYANDIEHSEYSGPLLAEFLRELAASNLRVTILAHSMGNRLVLVTLSGFARGRYPVKQGFIDELVLAAADVGIEPGNDDFAHLLRDAAPYVRRTTIYASSGDAVLTISKGEHGGVPRLGREPEAALSYRVDDKTHIVDVIDASGVPADLLDHSYFAMSYEALADMSLTLAGVPTADRLTAIDGWKPTLVCANAKDGPCGSDQRYALAAGKGRQPRLISRILVKLIPLIPFAQ